jgi:Response regulator containing CheY-like receiver domain and AraC-type DNA-binding domain
MLKVLIIDDEIWTRKTVRAFGDWDRHKITTIDEACDGIEGLRLIKENNPQIVITDMNMPGLGGVDLLRMLNEDFPNIKLIVISGYNDFEFTKQAIKSKAIDYILKPIDKQELNAAIGKCVSEIKAQSIYGLGKEIDKNTLSLIMNEKKVIERLLVERNLWGIKNTLKRLYDNIIQNKIQEKTVIKVTIKVFKEMTEEYILTTENLMNAAAEENIIELNIEDLEKKSLHEVFALIYSNIEKAIIYVNENTRCNSMSTIAQVKAYVELHYTEHISLDKLSSLFFLSKEYLSKAFKSKYNKNLMNYVLDLRMLKAKEMLEIKDISIKNIAEAVGYEDLTHFYHVFKNYYGSSPGDMRKEG